MIDSTIWIRLEILSSFKYLNEDQHRRYIYIEDPIFLSQIFKNIKEEKESAT